jgi:hypothetical protein
LRVPLLMLPSLPLRRPLLLLPLLPKLLPLGQTMQARVLQLVLQSLPLPLQSQPHLLTRPLLQLLPCLLQVHCLQFVCPFSYFKLSLALKSRKQ